MESFGGGDALAEMLQQQCSVQHTPASRGDTSATRSAGSIRSGGPSQGRFAHPASAFSVWPRGEVDAHDAGSMTDDRAPRPSQGQNGIRDTAWGGGGGGGASRLDLPTQSDARGSGRHLQERGAHAASGWPHHGGGRVDGGYSHGGLGGCAADFAAEFSLADALPLGGLEITAAPQMSSAIYAERHLCNLIAGTELGNIPGGTHGIEVMKSMLGEMLWCCNECDRWAEDDGYAARAVVTEMRAGAVALQVQLHRRLWPMCGEWQSGARKMCPEHGPELLAQIGAPSQDRWPTTVAEREQVIADLEEATSEIAMSAVWATADAVTEALGRIEWLLAPGEINWVEQTPADPGRLTDITSQLRRSQLLQLWIQIHRHDHPECRANDVGFTSLPLWGPSLCIHHPKLIDPRSHKH